MSLHQEINFALNGVSTNVSVSVEMSALDMIRTVFGMTGTKYGCGEGECGACTILVDGISLNACLLFAVDCDGRKITTIEGLANDAMGSRLEREFATSGAVQCGFCSPGLVVQARHLLDKHPDANRAQIQRGIEGNLCRCTGYVKIVDAIVSAAAAAAAVAEKEA